MKTDNGESSGLDLTTEWQKFDIPTAPLFQNLTDWWAFEIHATEVQTTAGYLLFDRFGMETTFDPSPPVRLATNTDATIASDDILSGGSYLDSLRQRLSSNEAFTIFAWGDSISAGGPDEPWR